jgi:hypothetical protein
MPHTIQSNGDYERVLERLHDLAGCLEDTPEERELIQIEFKLAVWEAKLRRALR